MRNEDNDAGTSGLGKTQTPIGTRRQGDMYRDAVCRLIVTFVFFTILFVIAQILAKNAYSFAAGSNRTNWLVMVSSVATGGLIAGLVIKLGEDLLKEIIDTIRAAFEHDETQYLQHLYGFAKHLYYPFLIMFVAHVLNHHTKVSAEPDLKTFVNIEAKRALRDQGYTERRADLIDLLRNLHEKYYYARFPITFPEAVLTDTFRPGETDISKGEVQGGCRIHRRR